MDSTIEHTTRRAKRIHTVEIALIEIKNKKRLLDMGEFVNYVCERFICSERTAKEYIRIAKSRIKGGMMDEEWAKPDPLYDDRNKEENKM